MAAVRGSSRALSMVSLRLFDNESRSDATIILSHTAYLYAAVLNGPGTLQTEDQSSLREATVVSLVQAARLLLILLLVLALSYYEKMTIGLSSLSVA